MAVTIKDVAREAGVSIATVSKIINGAPGISEATTRRVEEVMRGIFLCFRLYSGLCGPLGPAK